MEGRGGGKVGGGSGRQGAGLENVAKGDTKSEAGLTCLERKFNLKKSFEKLGLRVHLGFGVLTRAWD